jgi:hypothetical protein
MIAQSVRMDHHSRGQYKKKARHHKPLGRLSSWKFEKNLACQVRNSQKT